MARRFHAQAQVDGAFAQIRVFSGQTGVAMR
jgi:hypothetical protein